MTDWDSKEEPKFHWERPPHDYNYSNRDVDVHVIVCDWEDCDWWGTAYASQFALHTIRRHDSKP